MRQTHAPCKRRDPSLKPQVIKAHEWVSYSTPCALGGTRLGRLGSNPAKQEKDTLLYIKERI